MKYRYLPAGAAVILLTIFFVRAVQAQEIPRQPLRIYGSVTGTASDVAVVAQTAKATCVKAVPVIGGLYGTSPNLLNFPQDNPATSPVEGAAPGEVVSVFVDPDEASTTTFPTGGGIQNVDITVSTSQRLSVNFAASGAGSSWDLSGADTAVSTGAAITDAKVNINWGDGTVCDEPTSDGSGAYSASHSYGAAGQFTVTTVAYKAGAAADLSSTVVTVVSGTPAASPTPTPTVVAGPAPSATPPPSFGGGGGGGGGGFIILPTATPTTVPTPTPVTAEGLGELQTGEAAAIIGGLDSDAAATIIGDLDSGTAAEIIDELSVTEAADIIGELTAEKAAAIIIGLAADTAAGVLQEVATETAADIIDDISSQNAASIIERVDTDTAADVIEALAPNSAASIIEHVSTGAAADIIARVEPDGAADIIEQVETTRAADIIAAVETVGAASIIERVETGHAASIIGVVDVAKASDILSEVAPAQAGAILEMVPTERVTDVVQLMDEEKLIERLPQMSPQKLFQVPAEVLIQELPSVPVEVITAEVVPDALAQLPVQIATTPDSAIYETGESPAQAWIVLVGSPFPIDRILGKFNSATSDIRVTVEDLSALPLGALDFPAGETVHSIFSIGVENVEPSEFASAHVTFFVEKGWFEENNAHKWSIQFNRFDKDEASWVRHSAKRVREDEDSVFTP